MTPADMNALNEEVMRLAPVIPVLVVDDAATARPLAEALVAGGLPALEVTLRTPAALDAIRAMAEVPGGRVGAGTLLTPDGREGRQGRRRHLRRLARGHAAAGAGLRRRRPAAAGRHASPRPRSWR